MATITKSYESNKDLTIFTVVGETSFDEIWAQTCVLLEGVPAKLVLWDFTSGTVGNISSEEVRLIADRGGPDFKQNCRRKGCYLCPKGS